MERHQKWYSTFDTIA